jgi:DNA mismatch repair protein PMS2
MEKKRKRDEEEHQDDEKNKKISKMNQNTTHLISSQQVIVSISAVIKELMDNSLDAGSTQLDIKLVDQGLTLISVSDNGTGIDPNSYENLVKKYHTSKISKFEDLSSVKSFGFRGEVCYCF